MSLLSTFAILFETDAKKAADDVEDLSDALDDVEKGAEGATGATDDTTKAFNDNAVSVGALTKTMVGLIGSLVAVDAIASKIFDTAANIDTIGKLSQTIGLNIVELDAWGAAAERNGGSAEALRGTVESLQGSLQDINITGGGEIINTLAMIGVQATKANGEIKSAFEVLPEIADAFSKMSTEQSFAFGKRLGLDQGTILTLQQSRYEVEKLVERQKALGGVTREGYETAAKFNDAWDDSKRSLNSWWQTANNNILPVFTKILAGFESISTWIFNNKDIAADALTGVALVLVPIFAPISAIVIALAAITEDVWAWVNGSKSAIGELIGSFEELKSKLVGIFDSLVSEWDEFVKAIKNTPKIISDVLFNNNKMSLAVETTMNEDDVPSGTVFRERTTLNEDGVPSGSDVALATIARYSATNLNHGGSTVNQRTQQNTFNVGGATVDARGMTGNQAKSVINASMKESYEMALGQLEDGVQR